MLVVLAAPVVGSATLFNYIVLFNPHLPVGNAPGWMGMIVGEYFLVQSGQVEVAKISDFGLAKFLVSPVDSAAATIGTVTGVPVGTPQYMSPDQLNGEAASVAWDIWALAVITYEMLTGTHPYSCNLRRPDALFDRQRAVPRLPLICRCAGGTAAVFRAGPKPQNRSTAAVSKRIYCRFGKSICLCREQHLEISRASNTTGLHV
jgi:serine/threonine protein kinase